MHFALRWNKYAFLLCWLLCSSVAMAQDYHALNGSPYAGGLGVHNNPASIVSNPFPWDLTLMGVQLKGSSNFIRIQNYSLLSSPLSSQYELKAGNFSRYADLGTNINIFNARLALGRKRAIAFGMRARSYLQAKSSPYNFIDTLQRAADFFKLNEQNQPLGLSLTGSSWLELYASYAQTILDNAWGRLQAGVSLSVSRGLAGAYARISNGRFSRLSGAEPASYLLEKAYWNYGYSANFDQWKDGDPLSDNMNRFFQFTDGGASMDLGLEFLVKNQAPSTVFDEDDYFDYEWKIGLALLDAGINRFKYGRESRAGLDFNSRATDIRLENSFDTSISNLSDFNDSVEVIAAGLGQPGGQFNIMNPMRLVLNVDRPLGNHFFLNAELSLNLGPLMPGDRLYVKQMNQLAITPRWENRHFGFYMPLQLNTHQQLWLGAAFKAGPLLFGLHSLGHLFSKNSFPNGGGYIALIFRAPQLTGKHYDKRLDCPSL